MATRDRKPRSIFEEVGEAKAAPAPAGPARRRDSRRAIAVWLAVLFALVVAMIAVGGLTRLTDSGLSITEWRPVTGAIPPLDDAAWTAEFEKYRASPQYAETNAGMTIDEFRTIYWWEWGHRALGRLVGLVWAGGLPRLLADPPPAAGLAAAPPRARRPRRPAGRDRLVDGPLGPRARHGLGRLDPARRPPRPRLRAARADRLVRDAPLAPRGRALPGPPPAQRGADRLGDRRSPPSPSCRSCSARSSPASTPAAATSTGR